MNPLTDVRAVCFDCGGALMSEEGPQDLPMGLWPDVALIPGAAACVSSLASKLLMAIATNASISTKPLIELALSRVGLKHYFPHIFCFTELGLRKGEPEFWHIAAARLGVKVEQVAMVGDSYDQDAALPRRVGVQGVWFNRQRAPLGKLGPVPQVSHLSQFSEWVSDAA